MSWASLVLRTVLGIMFMAHGSQKAFGMLGGPGIKGFSQMLAGLGFSPAVFWAYVVAYLELIGGLFLILGVFMRSSAILLLTMIIVAIVKVHLPNGFFMSQGGFEYTLIIAASLIALLIIGPGKFSILRKF